MAYAYYKVYFSDNPRVRGTRYKLIQAQSAEQARSIFLSSNPGTYITDIVKA